MSEAKDCDQLLVPPGAGAEVPGDSGGCGGVYLTVRAAPPDGLRALQKMGTIRVK